MVLKITVKTLDNQSDPTFEVAEDWTVKQFKEHIKDEVRCPANQQKLIFCGRVLQDEKKLNEYDNNEMVLHLVRWSKPLPAVSSQQQPSSDTNNNNQRRQQPEPLAVNRSGDESNVLFSAMTIGPDVTFQHMVTLQQAIVTRILEHQSNPSNSSSNEPNTLAEIHRQLHNASRLLRVAAHTLNECMARIATLSNNQNQQQSGQQQQQQTNQSSRQNTTTNNASFSDIPIDEDMAPIDDHPPLQATVTIEVEDLNLLNQPSTQRGSHHRQPIQQSRPSQNRENPIQTSSAEQQQHSAPVVAPKRSRQDNQFQSTSSASTSHQQTTGATTLPNYSHQQLDQMFSNHRSWVPVIENDIKTMQAQFGDKSSSDRNK